MAVKRAPSSKEQQKITKFLRILAQQLHAEYGVLSPADVEEKYKTAVDSLPSQTKLKSILEAFGIHTGATALLRELNLLNVENKNDVVHSFDFLGCTPNGYSLALSEASTEIKQRKTLAISPFAPSKLFNSCFPVNGSMSSLKSCLEAFIADESGCFRDGGISFYVKCFYTRLSEVCKTLSMDKTELASELAELCSRFFMFYNMRHDDVNTTNVFKTVDDVLYTPTNTIEYDGENSILSSKDNDKSSNLVKLFSLYVFCQSIAMKDKYQDTDVASTVMLINLTLRRNHSSSYARSLCCLLQTLLIKDTTKNGTTKFAKNRTTKFAKNVNAYFTTAVCHNLIDVVPETILSLRQNSSKENFDGFEFSQLFLQHILIVRLLGEPGNMLTNSMKQSARRAMQKCKNVWNNPPKMLWRWLKRAVKGANSMKDSIDEVAMSSFHPIIAAGRKSSSVALFFNGTMISPFQVFNLLQLFEESSTIASIDPKNDETKSNTDKESSEPLFFIDSSGSNKTRAQLALLKGMNDENNNEDEDTFRSAARAICEIKTLPEQSDDENSSEESLEEDEYLNNEVKESPLKRQKIQ